MTEFLGKGVLTLVSWYKITIMKTNQLNRTFLDQFRRSCVCYLIRKEKKYGDIALKQVSGSSNEYQFIRNLVYNKLSRVATPARLANEIFRKDIPNVDQLLSFTTALRMILSGYCMNEPLTTCYYKPFISTLDKFMPVLRRYRSVLNNESLKKLMATDPGKKNKNRFDEEEMKVVFDNVSAYLSHLDRFRDHFTNLLKQESTMFTGLSVTTQVEQYLLQLVSFIENNILVATETFDGIEEWLKKLDILELQEVYN